jgi:hypothetical protein
MYAVSFKSLYSVLHWDSDGSFGTLLPVLWDSHTLCCVLREFVFCHCNSVPSPLRLGLFLDLLFPAVAALQAVYTYQGWTLLWCYLLNDSSVLFRIMSSITCTVGRVATPLAVPLHICSSNEGKNRNIVFVRRHICSIPYMQMCNCDTT